MLLFFNHFLGSLAMMLIIFLEKGIYWLDKNQNILEVLQHDVESPNLLILLEAGLRFMDSRVSF